jgi:6-pyruvoyltetrahydropterin/6-carboxytetrahydropterin synthase
MANSTESITCRVVRRSHFCAALKSADGRLEGHNYILEAYVQGPIQMGSGMVLGVKELEEILLKTTSRLDHKHLNEDVEFFQGKPVTTENLAHFCFFDVKNNLSSFTNLELNKIRLFETDDFWVDYGPNIQSEV